MKTYKWTQVLKSEKERYFWKECWFWINIETLFQNFQNKNAATSYDVFLSHMKSLLKVR